MASRTVAYGTDKGEVLGNVENYGGNDTIHAGGGDDEVYAGDGDDKVYGEAGDDKLYGSSGKDILEGGEGNDLLDGGVGDDILVGGAGDDVLEGSYGSDTYVYNKGDGHDVINNYAYSGVQDKDVLKFGEGISSEDLEVIRRGNDVTFSLKDGTGSVRVQNHFWDDSCKLDEVEFSDGTKWSTGDVESRAVSYEPGTNAAASAEPTRAPAAPEAFSAVLPSSAMSESEAGVLSETEAEESLAALSTPSFMSSLDHDDIEGLGGGTSLASVLPDSLAPVDSETARLGMDVALAGLSFEAPGSGQVCDALLSGSSGVEAVKLSVASEASLEKHFEDGARYDELPKSAAWPKRVGMRMGAPPMNSPGTGSSTGSSRGGAEDPGSRRIRLMPSTGSWPPRSGSPSTPLR